MANNKVPTPQTPATPTDDDQCSCGTLEASRQSGFDRASMDRGNAGGRNSFDRIAEFSHDIRTPLCVINEYASLMREGILGILNKEQYAAADAICDRAEELQRLTETLLQESKLAAETSEVPQERGCVEELLHDVATGFGEISPIRRQSLQPDVENHPGSNVT